MHPVHSFILKCVLQYFEPFCFKPIENFISLHISDNIGYTFLDFNITDSPLTYHTRGGSIELYLHCMTFSVRSQCFVPHNDLLLPICNIVTATHLLFTKYLSSEFHECLAKEFFLFNLFISIQLLYLSGMNGLTSFTTSVFGTEIPRCCCFTTLYSFSPLQ